MKKLLSILILCSVLQIFGQNTITIPFNDGFIGTSGGQGTSTTSYHISYLGLTNLQFSQNSSSTVFTAQGNDIIGNVIITDKNNIEHTISGFIKWRYPSGNSPNTAVFQPSATTNKTIATNGLNGSSTYTINANTYIGLTFNGFTNSFTEGSELRGNAATTGLLDFLNSYLGTLPSLSIANATATEGLPNVSVAVTMSTQTSNQVKVNYTTSDGTALYNSNYTTTSGTLTFAANTTTISQNIVVPIIDNQTNDNNKVFYVQISDPINASIAKPTGNITISDTDSSLSTSETPSNQTALLIKQNPVKNGTAVIEYTSTKNGLLSIFDMNGKLIETRNLESATNTKKSITIPSLKKGTYILTFKSGDQIAVSKMIVE